MKQAIVIGSGIAGIASALRLRAKGYDVSVFEKNAYTGGKLSEIRLNAYRFDAGPSLFTLPEQVDELFYLFGENPREHFNYKQLDTVCNYFWDDGSRLNASGNTEKFAHEAARVCGGDEKSIHRYLKKSRFIYETTAPVFLDQSLHKLKNYLNVKTLKGVLRMPVLGIFGKLNNANTKQLKNEKLVQLFNRYATYNGSDPYRAPAVLQSIPHLEFHTGAWLPEGGMRSISKSLTELAVRHGIQFYYSTEVKKIRIAQNCVSGIESGTTFYPADLVVCNSDVFTAYRSLLCDYKAPERILHQERSSSALIFYWGIGKHFDALDVHNIFFSSDYREEFRLLFEGKTVSEDPTVYVHITSIHEKQDAPEGCANWFVMVNVPGDTGQDWEKLRTKIRKSILQKLERNLGEAIEPLIETEDYLDPRRIATRTFSHQGSLYGASSNSMFAAFLRHANFSSSIKNLWFCGGSVHPGGGIPLCLKSAKIAASMIPKAKR
jgi:phytoene desaturase